jgi:hypothetical protein
MIEIPEYDPVMVAEIDDLIYRFNLEYDVFISALFFGKNELEEGPLSEAPIYKGDSDKIGHVFRVKTAVSSDANRPPGRSEATMAF